MKQHPLKFIVIALSFAGLSACSGGSKDEAIAGSEWAKQEKIATYKGDSKSEEPIREALNDDLGHEGSDLPKARAPKSKAAKSEKTEASADKKSDLEQLLEIRKQETELAQQLARQDRIAKRSAESAKSREMMQWASLLSVLVTARQAEQAMKATSNRGEDPDCESSAVGTAKDDFSDLLETMAAYGMVSQVAK